MTQEQVDKALVRVAWMLLQKAEEQGAVTAEEFAISEALWQHPALRRVIWGQE